MADEFTHACIMNHGTRYSGKSMTTVVNKKSPHIWHMSHFLLDAKARFILNLKRPAWWAQIMWHFRSESLWMIVIHPILVQILKAFRSFLRG